MKTEAHSRVVTDAWREAARATIALRFGGDAGAASANAAAPGEDGAAARRERDGAWFEEMVAPALRSGGDMRPAVQRITERGGVCTKVRPRRTMV
jgi:hypothetical protein